MDYAASPSAITYGFDTLDWIAPARAVPKSPPATRLAVQPRAPVFGEKACDDLPVEVGHMLVGSYVAILAAFAIGFFHSAEVLFMLGVCAVYLAVYLGVPAIFLRVEPVAGKRPDFETFMEQGLSTFTGRVSGGAALAQMLTIPLAVAGAAAGIGLIMHIVG